MSKSQFVKNIVSESVSKKESNFKNNKNSETPAMRETGLEPRQVGKFVQGG